MMRNNAFRFAESEVNNNQPYETLHNNTCNPLQKTKGRAKGELDKSYQPFAKPFACCFRQLVALETSKPYCIFLRRKQHAETREKHGNGLWWWKHRLCFRTKSNMQRVGKKSTGKGNKEGNMRGYVRTGWGDGYGQKDRDLLLADS